MHDALEYLREGRAAGVVVDRVRLRLFLGDELLHGSLECAVEEVGEEVELSVGATQRFTACPECAFEASRAWPDEEAACRAASFLTHLLSSAQVGEWREAERNLSSSLWRDGLDTLRSIPVGQPALAALEPRIEALLKRWEELMDSEAVRAATLCLVRAERAQGSGHLSGGTGREHSLQQAAWDVWSHGALQGEVLGGREVLKAVGAPEWEELGRVVEGWSSAASAELGEESLALVARVEQCHDSDVRALLRSHTVARAGQRRLVASPREALLWAKKHGGENFAMTLLGAREESDTSAVLETAVGVWSPGSGDTLASAREALGAARKIFR